MRKWKNVGSISSAGSLHSRDESEVRSNQSRSKSPFRSFHQNLQNKSGDLITSNEKTFCHDYIQRNRQNSENLTFDLVRSEKNIRLSQKSQKGGDDMFTSMRNILKDEEKQSQLSSKSLEDHSSKLHSGSQTERGKDKLQKTVSKLKVLKKEQVKLKKHLDTNLSGIKNIFYQFQEVFHNINKFPQNKKVQQSSSMYDPELLRDIMTEATFVEKYFADMDRKKAEIMNRLENQ